MLCQQAAAHEQVMAIGSTTAGLLADGLVRRGMSVTNVRKLVQTIAFMVPAGAVSLLPIYAAAQLLFKPPADVNFRLQYPPTDVEQGWQSCRGTLGAGKSQHLKIRCCGMLDRSIRSDFSR